VENDSIVYAGFWRRWAALFIDGLVLGIPVIVLAVLLAIPFGLFSQNSTETAGFIVQGVYYLLWLISAPLYYALQESSSYQATVGKRALGIKVTDLEGKRISFANALGRWFAAALSYLTLYIGFLMAAFTDRKQALHDRIAGTLVTDKWAFTDHPERQKRELSGCLIAVIVGVVLFIPMVAILAAIALPAYQDYTLRAKVAQAIAIATPLEQAVVDERARSGTCPGNGDGAIGQAASYANSYVASIETGTMQNGGNCGIQITLRGTASDHIDGKRIWLELDTNKGTWACSSEIDNRYLSANCRS
jgi:uncharacterized RDD family membrane protein YckC/Tfp pilus assembly major pilin PilA